MSSGDTIRNSELRRILTLSRSALTVGCTASGRKAREPLAVSLNPTHGRDLSGITAVLRSVARIDFTGPRTLFESLERIM